SEVSRRPTSPSPGPARFRSLPLLPSLLSDAFFTTEARLAALCAWRSVASRNRRIGRVTAEYAEYAEREQASGRISAYFAYSAVNSRWLRLGCSAPPVPLWGNLLWEWFGDYRFNHRDAASRNRRIGESNRGIRKYAERKQAAGRIFAYFAYSAVQPSSGCS